MSFMPIMYSVVLGAFVLLGLWHLLQTRRARRGGESMHFPDQKKCLNNRRLICLWVMGVAIGLLCLYPPWSVTMNAAAGSSVFSIPMGKERAPIWQQRKKADIVKDEDKGKSIGIIVRKISFEQLALEAVPILALGALLFLTLRNITPAVMRPPPEPGVE